MTTRTLVSAALEYAQRGWYVFPCKPGDKRPLTANGFKDATTDANKIRDWWRQWPNANIGIATGQSGLVVIDLDVKGPHNGVEAWHDIKATLGINDETPTVETPSGGLHIYYSAGGRRIRNSASKLAEGIDVRAQGGYVVAPPSHTSDGVYTWALGMSPDEMQLAVLPEAIASALIEIMPSEPTYDGIIPKGQRNETLARIAGALRRKGLSESAILAALLAENAQRCSPPLREDEVRRIAKSIARYPSPGTIIEDTGDRGHAKALEAVWRGRYIYAQHLGRWMMWNGRAWESISNESALKQATDTLVDIYSTKYDLAYDEEERKLWRKRIAEVSSIWHISAALKLLAGTEGFWATAADFDRDPWLLNVQNGVLSLKTFELLPHSPEFLCSKIANVTFDTNAKAERWQEHIKYFLPDADVMRHVQRDLGLMLVGVPLEERLSIWHGTGANGKSTTARVIMEILNDYAGMAAPGALIQRAHDAHPTEIADLLGKRCVFASEISGAARLDEAKVKQITGGDRQKARFLYKDFFEFEQTWGIVLLCNHKPIITGADDGIWRRIRLIPWRVSVTPEMRRPQREVVDELLEESSGILNWLIAGLKDWLADSYWSSPSVSAATAFYREDTDRVGAFIESFCRVGDGLWVGAKELYDAYVAWCTMSGEEPASQTAFGRNLSDRGFLRRRHGKTRKTIYEGLALAYDVSGEDEDDQDLPTSIDDLDALFD